MRNGKHVRNKRLMSMNVFVDINGPGVSVKALDTNGQPCRSKGDGCLAALSVMPSARGWLKIRPGRFAEIQPRVENESLKKSRIEQTNEAKSLKSEV